MSAAAIVAALAAADANRGLLVRRGVLGLLRPALKVKTPINLKRHYHNPAPETMRVSRALSD